MVSGRYPGYRSRWSDQLIVGVWRELATRFVAGRRTGGAWPMQDGLDRGDAALRRVYDFVAPRIRWNAPRNARSWRWIDEPDKTITLRPALAVERHSEPRDFGSITWSAIPGDGFANCALRFKISLPIQKFKQIHCVEGCPSPTIVYVSISRNCGPRHISEYRHYHHLFTQSITVTN